MTVRPARRVGGPGRRRPLIRRRSAGLTRVRAGAALAVLLSAGAIYGLAATSAFGFERLDVKGAVITNDDAIRDRLGLDEGTNLFEIATEPLEARLREIPAVAGAEVRVGLPNTVSVERPRAPADRRLAGRRQPLVRRRDRAAVRRRAGRAARGPGRAAADQRRPRGFARRSASGRPLDPVDLDVARRLASLTPAQVGSSASGLSVGVSDENGFTISSVPRSWVAVFGFYGLSLRTPDLVPAQVVLLQQLLQQAGEDTVALVILADATDGTYIPKASPSPSPSP